MHDYDVIGAGNAALAASVSAKENGADRVLVLGECQGSCRLNYVMIPPIDEAAVLAAQMSGDANLRLVMSVPRCSLRRRSGARQPRHARARQGALRVAAGGSAPPISFVALRGLGAARSGRESRFADRTGKLDL
jgi:hypothetical protein